MRIEVTLLTGPEDGNVWQIEPTVVWLADELVPYDEITIPTDDEFRDNQ